MNSFLGLMRIKIIRGKNLAVRDVGQGSSDPYVVVTLAHQKLKTSVIKHNCNPEWNEELTLSISDPNNPINLTVFDKDTFTEDDEMGQAKVDIKPYIAALRMGLEAEELYAGCVVSRVQPSKDNCLSDESRIIYNKGKLVQYMSLRLKKVERGELDISLEWIDVPGCKGLAGAA